MNAACASASSFFIHKLYPLKIVLKMKIKWSTIKQIIKSAATIITTVAGTLAVQSCGPSLF